MDKRIVQRLEAKIGDRLMSMGYELSEYPRITISVIEEIYLRANSRFGTFNYRI